MDDATPPDEAPPPSSAPPDTAGGLSGLPPEASAPVPGAEGFTEQGAPTDAAHQDAGDGSLTGATPAGLTVDELLDQAASGKTDDGGTG